MWPFISLLPAMLPVRPTLIEIRYEVEEQEAVQAAAVKLSADAKAAQLQEHGQAPLPPARDNVLPPSIAQIHARIGFTGERK